MTGFKGEAVMTNSSGKAAGAIERLRTPKEAADFLRKSDSFLAKARMNGDGPAYIKVGRSVLYSETALQQWLRSRQRLSTSEQ